LKGSTSPRTLIRTFAHDSVCPGICTRPGCDYAVEIEPDQDEGWCEECHERSVQSALILAGIV
jgi:hypothetical protein